ncbi:MAG: hypothetical protein IPL61_27575 [Myxococcales bacterium]|nr:hypothetical protein [Myxococcales bacterium]
MRPPSAPRPPAAAAPPVDGRRARTVRTRGAILDALMALVRAGEINPTAAAIAARAQVSLRSIGQHFPTRGDLFGAAAALYQERPDSPEPAAALPVAARVAAFVPIRARELEGSRPIRASAAQFAADYPVVAAAIAGNAARRRAQVARVFAAEVADHPDRLELLDLALGGPVWDALRARALVPARAQALVRRMVAQLVAL